MPIAVHQDCHPSRWLPLSSHSCAIFISAHTVSPSAHTLSYSNPYGYSLLCKHSLQPSSRIRFSTLLFGILYFSLYSCSFLFVVQQQITQSLTKAYALIYAQPRSSNSSASPHVLGFNTYIARSFGHSS